MRFMSMSFHKVVNCFLNAKICIKIHIFHTLEQTVIHERAGLFYFLPPFWHFTAFWTLVVFLSSQLTLTFSPVEQDLSQLHLSHA